MRYTSSHNVEYEYKERLNNVGELIKRLRVSAGLSQRDLAEECGIQQCQVSKLEQGNYSGLYTIYKVSLFFEVDVSDLIKGVNYTFK